MADDRAELPLLDLGAGGADFIGPENLRTTQRHPSPICLRRRGAGGLSPAGFHPLHLGHRARSRRPRRIHRTLPPAKLAEIEEALALTDRIVSAEDAGHDEALSALAAIRQSLRQGTMTTRQIKRA